MTMDQALDILNVLHSGDDPIVFEGVQTTPEDLFQTVDEEGWIQPAKSVEVEFFSQGKLMKGTFFSLVIDRMLA